MLYPGARFQARAEDLGPADGSLLRHAGQLDFKNRYSSAVMVTMGEPTAGAQCSGVLLSPRVVLTAGSCVCQPTNPKASGDAGGRIIGTSACARRAYGLTVVYGTVHDESTANREVQTYAGTVRPHPDLARADLAIIVLDEAVEGGIPYASLPSVEVTASESLVMVGYGHDKEVQQVTGDRYVRRNKLSQAPIAGAGAYAQHGAYVYSDNTGWACFRDDASGHWLVGVASRTSGGKSAFVSTYFHRDWLRSEIQRAVMAQESRP